MQHHRRLQGSFLILASVMNPKRSTKDGPFCWQTKKVLRLIRDHFDDTNSASSALAVYLSLTEIASDGKSEVFQRRILEIAERAGVSYKTAAKVLSRLEALSIIAITRNKISGTKENAPSTYTLLKLGNDNPTSGNRPNQQPFPREEEECPEEYPEPPSERQGASHHSDEWRSSYLDSELEIIDLYNEICVPHGWRPVNKDSEQLAGALEKLGESNDLETFQEMFETAVAERNEGDSPYNKRLGNKLIRILWNNY
jgi:hypothetical protein